VNSLLSSSTPAGSAGFGLAMAATQGTSVMDIESQASFRAAKALRIRDRANVKLINDAARIRNIANVARMLSNAPSQFDDCDDDSVIELMREHDAMANDTLSVYY
jgi:hypothetical protein